MNLAILFIIWISSVAHPVAADDITGTWLTPGDDAAKISIYKSGGKYYGKITWLQVPVKNGKPRVDENNADVSRRNDPIIGMVLVKDFVWDPEDEEWDSGRVYDPKSGNTYSGYLKLIDKDRLKLRGFIGISLIGRTEYWARVLS